MKTQSTMALSDNKMFVQLVRSCQDDQELQKTLSRVLQLPDFQRKSVIGSITHIMRIENAPMELISAIEALRDPEVANKMRQIIKREAG